MQIPRRAIRFASVLAMLFSLAALGQVQSPPATPPSAKGEISGIVTDAATGRPIAGAQVVVLTPPLGVMGGVLPVPLVGSSCDYCDIFGTLHFETLTDSRGRFTIRNVPRGQYMVRALARGYAAQYYQVQERYSAPNAFFLRPGQKRNDIRIRLPRPAVLTGRVLDEHGQPVISAYVQLMQYGPPTVMQKRLHIVTATVTDDRGEYRLFGLLPGRYYIRARYEPGFDLSPFRPSDVAKRFLSPSVSLATFSPHFYYPGVTESAEAKPIEAGPGQVVSGLDISVRSLTPAERAKLFPRRFPTPPAGDCQVSGVVTNAASGKPVDHAWVFLQPRYGAMQPPFAKTLTDSGGRFDFHGVSCAFPLPVLAWKDGFVEAFHSPVNSYYPPGVKIRPRRKRKITRVNLALIPAGVITGKITDAHGRPAACLRVVLVYRSYRGFRKWLWPLRETTTDDRGRYRFYQLWAGRYYVAAQIQPSNAVATQTTMAFAAAATPSSGATFASPYVYYPSTAKVEDAALIHLAPGQEVNGVDFSVKPETTYSIRGVVEGPTLQAAKRGLRLVLTPAHGPYGLPFPVHESPIDASGNFQIDGVTSGSYTLWAMTHLHHGQYVAWTPITVGHSNITGVTLDPHPGWTISGHLRVEGQPQQKFLYEILAQQLDEPFIAGTARARRVPPGGSFELKGLLPGRYRILVDALPAKRQRRFTGPLLDPVEPRPLMYLKSARFGAQDVRTKPLKVSMQGVTGALDLTVDWDGAQVEGTVVNSRGEPADSAEIVLIPENHDQIAWWQMIFVQPYLHGRFWMGAVGPGKYRLFAWEHVPNGAWLDPHFLDAQWKRGMILDLSEGETKSVKLHVLDVPIQPMPRGR